MKVVSYKTAKLAVEKGCFIFTRSYYDVNKKLHDNSYGKGVTYTFQYPAPYQTELCTWLREEHSIHITADVELDSNKYYLIISYTTNGHSVFDYSGVLGNLYSTYEDAIEAGLQAVLKFLTIV